VAGTIVAMGGLSWDDEERRRLEDYFLSFARRSERPKMLFVPTAAAENAQQTLWIYEQFAGRVEVSHLPFFPWPPENLRELVLDQDVIYVSGGNTANALAVWRVHGFDRILREAWEAGVVLTGWSAGMICWFEAGVTDSFGPQLEGMRDGLGFVPGSACPHYDGEERRRPRYTELVRDGFPGGIAIDDDVAVRFDGDTLAEAVTSREGAQAYRVSVEGEEALPTRMLD
jgi:peptidase E